MRLVCPNCEAKYEVPDDAIPDTGRDVQCANCGHAWYQMRPRAAAAETVVVPPAVVPTEQSPSAPTVETDAVAETVTDTMETAPEPEPEPEPEPVEPEPESVSGLVDAALVDTVPAAEAAPEAAPEPDPELPPPAPAAPAPASGYAVDDSVLAILREEAEREAAARRAEARPLEVQTDLGIETIPSAAPVVDDPASVDAIAESAGASLPDPVVTSETVASVIPVPVEDKPSARRDLLPDVEEINSTLRPSDTNVSDDGVEDASGARQGGFRSGFLSVMVVAMIAVALYVGAPLLSRLVPALAEPLTGYVALGNDLRLALDGLMQSATIALNGE